MAATAALRGVRAARPAAQQQSHSAAAPARLVAPSPVAVRGTLSARLSVAGLRSAHRGLRVGGRRLAVSAQAKGGQGNTDWDGEWSNAIKLMDEGATVTVKVEMANKGGVMVKLGKLKGFVPASQLDPSRFNAAESLMDQLVTLVGQSVSTKVITVEPERRSLVLSERAELREGTLAALKEGDVRKAVVRSLADFGAFVELLDDSGSASFVEGLVHVSEISWDRVLHPQEVLCAGDEVEVKVTSLERKKGRVGFSIRQMTDDPLLETLDTLMAPEDETDEEVWELGETMPDFPKLGVLCEMLTAQEGIQSVVPGRQALESRVVSQDLEMFMPKAAAEDGYNILVRTGRQVQEVHVVTSLSREEIKQVLVYVTSQLADLDDGVPAFE